MGGSPASEEVPMSPAVIETPPPDPKAGRDAEEAKKGKPERRHAAKWNPYLRRVCFHASSATQDAERVEDPEAIESPS